MTDCATEAQCIIKCMQMDMLFLCHWLSSSRKIYSYILWIIQPKSLQFAWQSQRH